MCVYAYAVTRTCSIWAKTKTKECLFTKLISEKCSFVYFLYCYLGMKMKHKNLSLGHESMRCAWCFLLILHSTSEARYGNELPPVDIFVCTADPTIEPPVLVMNTVLSVMAYDYPPEKLSIYVSDDGASELTFYALLEATDFVRHWISFCKRFNVEPRSPAAYFSSPEQHDLCYASELDRIKVICNSPSLFMLN